MRIVGKLEYEIIKKGNVDKSLIYAFANDKDVSFLCQKDNQFFWKSLQSVNWVWYKKYDTIEEAIEGVREVKEYKQERYGEIIEFSNIKDFIKWAFETTHEKLLSKEPYITVDLKGLE